MKLLVIGAAGRVGSILRPAFEAQHTCRYLDLQPIEGAESRTVVGSLLDHEALAEAVAGQDAVVQLAMAPVRHPDYADLAYDIHVKGMHHVLEAAHAAGARRVIYASTLSIYERYGRHTEPFDETVPGDAAELYGFTKRLGEEVCAAYCRRHPEFSVVALRMSGPRTADGWAKLLEAGHNSATCTGPEDLQRAYLNALSLNGHTGYDAVFICSDPAGKNLNLGKARSLLGWVPEGR